MRGGARVQGMGPAPAARPNMLRSSQNRLRSPFAARSAPPCHTSRCRCRACRGGCSSSAGEVWAEPQSCKKLRLFLNHNRLEGCCRGNSAPVPACARLCNMQPVPCACKHRYKIRMQCMPRTEAALTKMRMAGSGTQVGHVHLRAGWVEARQACVASQRAGRPSRGAVLLPAFPLGIKEPGTKAGWHLLEHRGRVCTCRHQGPAAAQHP